MWAFPEGGGLKAERDAEDKNREIIKNSTIDNWVPYYVLTNAAGDVIDEGSMVDCDQARHPAEFAGLDMLSVLTVDMSRGLRVADATGVLASGQTVYASTENLYVATQRWFDFAILEGDSDNADFTGVTTQIHQFDISDATKTEYVASGSVSGFLLNQFAMSEYDGRLRVASTTEPEWRRWGDFEQESMVTILEADNGELVTVGSVDGLGKGERIYSVRFIDETAYIVTFRQTDPLYTVDLSDPTNPEVLGELKILGYSAYLHPLGDDLLLGIGQDADEQGRTEGTQVSIFDVSDLRNPERIAQLTLAKGSNSQVEYDHRAFLYWAPEDLAVIPMQRWSWNERTDKQEVFFGAIGIDVGNRGHPRDRSDHPPGWHLGTKAYGTGKPRSSGRSSSATACTRSRTRVFSAATCRPWKTRCSSTSGTEAEGFSSRDPGSWILDAGQEWPPPRMEGAHLRSSPRSWIQDPDGLVD